MGDDDAEGLRKAERSGEKNSRNRHHSFAERSNDCVRAQIANKIIIILEVGVIDSRNALTNLPFSRSR
jgi:hypothetical protein